MMTLTDFLLARIAEDEAFARGGVHYSSCAHVVYDGTCDCNFLPRVLAECEAKRRIVALGEALEVGGDSFGYEILAALALPYVDHPDCREEWKP